MRSQESYEAKTKSLYFHISHNSIYPNIKTYQLLNKLPNIDKNNN